MRVEKGVPKSLTNYEDAPPNVSVSAKTLGVGVSAHKHGAGLMGEEACADGDTDEDD